MNKSENPGNLGVVSRNVTIHLVKEDGSFGFTLRGKQRTEADKSGPLVVTDVRQGGPAAREGTLKAGDRLVAIDGRDLSHLTLLEAQDMLRKTEHGADLTLQYDVSLMDSLRSRGDPLLVEIEPNSDSHLGINLYRSPSDVSAICIEHIRTASIADRCGALAVGDTVSAINGICLDHLTVSEANDLLENRRNEKITLEIIPSCPPAAVFSRRGGVLFPHIYGCADDYSQEKHLYRTLNSHKHPRNTGEDSSGICGKAQVSHTETIRINMLTEPRGCGIRLEYPALQGYDLHPRIVHIDPGGAADRAGVIGVGDRLLAVNGRDVGGLSTSETMQMMTNSFPNVMIDLEIDIMENVVPATGTFTVKLKKKFIGLGIKIAGMKLPDSPHDEVVLISDINQGSPAHRSGTLQIGDRILAINNSMIDHLSLQEVTQLLQEESPDRIVSLKVHKNDLFSEDGMTVYTVELVRQGGPLGITISGSEEPFEPHHIAGIVPGSLVDRTGALHEGDRLLAINAMPLRGKPLSDVILLLQGCEDPISLRVARPHRAELPNFSPTRDSTSAQAPSSVDSAFESWDGGGVEQGTAAPLTKCLIQPALSRDDCDHIGELAKETDCPKNCATDSSLKRKWASHSSSLNTSTSGDKTDWDKMIADLNQISETCGLRRPSLKTSGVRSSPTALASSSCTAYQTLSGRGHEVKIQFRPPVPSSPVLHTLKTHRSLPSTPEEGSYSVAKGQTFFPFGNAGISCSSSGSSNIETLCLSKDPFYEDFGFSVSDGLYEKGVYVNRTRKGGPADGILRPFDRILQVNGTPTHDFDCCLTVPLIAAAESKLELVVLRCSEELSLRVAKDTHIHTWLEDDGGPTSLPDQRRSPVLGDECHPGANGSDQDDAIVRSKLPQDIQDIHERSFAGLSNTELTSICMTMQRNCDITESLGIKNTSDSKRIYSV